MGPPSSPTGRARVFTFVTCSYPFSTDFCDGSLELLKAGWLGEMRLEAGCLGRRHVVRLRVSTHGDESGAAQLRVGASSAHQSLSDPDAAAAGPRWPRAQLLEQRRLAVIARAAPVTGPPGFAAVRG